MTGNGIRLTTTPRSREFDTGRMLAGAIGTMAIAVTARYTYGGVLLAPLGMAIAAWIARRRGRSTSKLTSWLAAIAAIWVVVVGALGVMALKAPPGSLSSIQHAADSIQTATPKRPPPAWLERIAPGSTARANAGQPMPIGQNMAVPLVIGALFSVGLLATFLGSLGWLATMPLAYAITGRWIGSPPRDSTLADAAAAT